MLSSGSPTVAEALRLARFAAVDPDASDGERMDALRDAWSLLVRGSGSGGALAAETLPSWALKHICTGEAAGLVWRNDTRHRLNDGLRAALGFDSNWLRPGEPVIPEVLDQKARTTVKCLRRNISWRVIEDERVFGRARFLTAPVEDLTGDDDVLQTTFCAEYRDAGERYRFGGNYKVSVIRARLGYFSTVHKAQGRQWPVVCLQEADALAHLQFTKVPLAARAKWFYTALSRTQGQVIIFRNLPADLESHEVASIVDSMRCTVEQFAGAEANWGDER